LLSWYTHLKSVALRFLGWSDYLRGVRPEHWQGPFNKQEGRQRIFRQLVESCAFSAIVETGTFRGDTTQYMYNQTQLPVYSAEVYPRPYGFSRARLRRFKGIHLFCMDSVEFLKLIWANGRVPKTGVFFYLDAHWYGKLPLKEEIAFIFDKWRDAVVMVDDFQVIGDEGYQYDDYGQTGVLALQLLADSSTPQLRKWFPSLPSADETGAKRGVVVLAQDARRCAILSGIDALREHIDDRV